MTARFRIFATDLETGEEFLCFTWTRSEQSGIDRAKADAERFGMRVTNIRAEAI